ncbi:isochorismatase family protein [uncultured Demequina sp.]|uniref:isochorismatase family protein n=1 Tax=uncultured Demequina sp. TaxID=693499 RepID=UPI0025D44E3E|nr:isochorismatase family protein [uncultured Demequina sp.]
MDNITESDATRAAIADQYSAAGFSGRVGFGRRPAVVVIDFAKAWLDPASPIGSDLSGAVAETIRILRAARASGTPVFFTTMAFEPDLSDVGQNVLRKKRHTEVQSKGSEWVELDPALERRPDEVLIVKQRASAFFGTPLLSQLIAHNVDTLIVTGCSTSGCIRASAQAAHDNNLRVIVPEGAVGDRNRAAHDSNIVDINARMADVVDVDDVLSYLETVNEGEAPR